MTSKLLELDQKQVDAIIELAKDEVTMLNSKIEEAVKDSFCKYETMEKISSRRNGLNALIDLLQGD